MCNKTLRNIQPSLAKLFVFYNVHALWPFELKLINRLVIYTYACATKLCSAKQLRMQLNDLSIDSIQVRHSLHVQHGF